MKKIALFMTLFLLLTVSMTACQLSKGCTQHVDANIDEACDVCGKFVEYIPTDIDFKDIYNDSYDPYLDEYTDYVVYSNATLKPALKNMSLDHSAEDLLLFCNYSANTGENKYAVVNTQTGAIVYTHEQEEDGADTISEIEIFGSYEGFIRVTSATTDENDNTTYNVKLLTSLGNEIISKEGSDITASYSTGDLFVIDEKVYEIKDGMATFKYELGLASSPNVDYSTKTNHYVVNSKSVYVYDLDYKVIASYKAPSYATSVSIYPLANGNIFIQYLKALPFDAAEYDVYEDAFAKYDLCSEILNIADGSITELELDFLVEELVNEVVYPELFDCYSSSASLINIASVYPIVDKTIDESQNKLANLRNDMLLLNYLGDAIEAQDSVQPIGHNRFAVHDELGRTFLVNELGEVIGEITNIDRYDSRLGLFEFDGKYYNLDLELVFDMNDFSYDYVTGGSGYAIYSETIEGNDESVVQYYLLNGITVTQLDLPKNISSLNAYSDYFRCRYFEQKLDQYGYVEEEHWYYTYYNRNGEEIYTIETTSDTYYDHWVSSYDNILLIFVKTRDADHNYTSNYYTAK